MRGLTGVSDLVDGVRGSSRLNHVQTMGLDGLLSVLPMLKKIDSGRLREGMFIQKLEGAWMDHPFWRRSFLIQDRAEIEAILASDIEEVWIDTGKGVDVAREDEKDARQPGAGNGVAALQEPAAVAPVRSSMEEEMARATRIYSHSKSIVRTMFAEARLGRAVDRHSAEKLVEEISHSLDRNPWALISVARLKTADEYTYMHSVAVCALMMALARQLGLGEAETREAGLAGMLHDLGKARIPLQILNKPGRLTDAEFEIMKRHPEAGHKLLQEMGGIGEMALDVCLRHHEKLDGTGYPQCLSSEGISMHARMGAVCDIYDAITSNRPYKKGWDPTESLRKMATWTQGHLDERIFHAFVKSVGIYPIGSFVRLESGLMGVVIEQGESSLLRPKVRVFFSAKSRAYIMPKVVDLSHPGSLDRVDSPENPVAWGVTNVEDFLG